jgi:Terminase RNaseH-like domain
VNTDVLLLEELGELLDYPINNFYLGPFAQAGKVSFGEQTNSDSEIKGERVEGAKKYAPTLRDFLMARLLKVRRKKGGIQYLKLNRAQYEFSIGATKRNIVLKARQLGITTYVAARFFLETITHPGTVSLQVAHSQEAAEELFRIVHRFLENLPESMQRGALKTSHANVRQIVFPGLDSEYRVATADENAGRGLTIHHLHCSEVARWTRGPDEALASLRAALVPDGEIVLESTPNGASGIFYQEWQEAEETGYSRHFFPWWYDYTYASKVEVPVRPFTVEEEELILKHGLTDAQIAWRREAFSTLRGLSVQEYAEDPVSCFRLSGECVFDQDAVDIAQTNLTDPMEIKDNRRLLIWLPSQVAREYIIGVDPAGGGSDGDYACAEVIERQTAMQCAELWGHFSPQELAQRLAELSKRYNGALVAVERNNHGHAVLAHLRMMGHVSVYQQEWKDGWLTSSSTRPAMLANLAAVLASEPRVFRSPRLLQELRTFVRYPDGNSAAAAGAHDDCVMAMAIALEVRRRIAGEAPREDVALASLAIG